MGNSQDQNPVILPEGATFGALSRDVVYDVINGERAYRDNLWGHGERGYRSVSDFLAYMKEYLDRAFKAYSTDEGSESTLHVIRKVTALGVACMEYNGAPRREGY